MDLRPPRSGRGRRSFAHVPHALSHLPQLRTLPPGVQRPTIRELLAPPTVASSRVSRSWDVEAEREYLARLSEIALPPSSTPIVSVVMPVRNRPEQLRDAVASVLGQTLGAFELLIVDDGSDDGNTPAVVADLASTDERIRAITLPPSGVSAARNAGLAAANGEFVAFLDSDNTWRPWFLRTCVVGLTKSGRGAAFAVVAERGGERPRYRTFVGDRGDLLLSNFIDLNALVVRRSLLQRVGGFDESLRRMVDYDLVLRLADLELPELLPFVGVEYSAAADSNRISTTEPLAWEDVVRTRRVADVTGLSAAGQPPLVSVIVDVPEDWQGALDTCRQLGAALGSQPVEMLLVVDGACGTAARLVAAAVQMDERIRLVVPPVRLHRSGAVDFAAMHSTGAVLVIAAPGETASGVSDEVSRAREDGHTFVSTATGNGFCVTPAIVFAALGGLDPLLRDEWGVADYARRAKSAGYAVTASSATPKTGSASVPVSRAENVRVWRERYGDAEPGTAGL